MFKEAESASKNDDKIAADTCVESRTGTYCQRRFKTKRMSIGNNTASHGKGIKGDTDPFYEPLKVLPESEYQMPLPPIIIGFLPFQ